MSKTILVTGGAGCIGSNFVPYFCKKYPEYHIINLDKLTYAGNLENVQECESMDNYTFVKGDICDRNLIEELFKKYDIRGVIHFAAESHVDNSIKNPFAFIQTNIEGTFTLIDVAYHHWMEAPNKVKSGYEDCRFHHISTDEVYGTLDFDNEMFTEKTHYAPNSPYSASKASSDFIVRAYHHTFGMNTTTSNCSNNYGPKQHSEKLIPTIIGILCATAVSLGGSLYYPIYNFIINNEDYTYYYWNDTRYIGYRPDTNDKTTFLALALNISLDKFI